jgi:hypothetical protein
METQSHLEPSEGWGKDYISPEEWSRLQTLLELVRREHHETQLSPERREQIRDRVLERVEQLEARRRHRVLLVAASTALLAGLLLTLVHRALWPDRA